MQARRRVGILCVHGIGDQERSQHVDIVARQFFRHLNQIYGRGNVFVDAQPGLETHSVNPDVSFGVRTNGETIIFDLVEVWWRDLGERPGFKRLIRFWWWALTIWTTTGFGARPGSGRVLPGHQNASPIRDFSIGFIERFRLFFQSVSFFVLLLPAQLVISILSMVPFVRRINFFQSVYAYMSSVKIYQQQESDTKQDVLDEVLSRRVRIQKRLANKFLDMAESDFDAWFVLAHSLGSVISFKTLMFDGAAFARSMSSVRWSHLDPRWKIKSAIPSEGFVDKPPLPWWLAPNDELNLEQLYDRFGGIVTYGSPIETFSTLWPSIIEINGSRSMRASWINLYDRRDFISSPINSMSALSDSLPITNIETRSHWLIAKSHTNYLNSKGRSAETIQDVIRWFAGDVDLDRLRQRSVTQHRFVRVALAITIQAIAILIVGAAIFPVALYGLLSFVFGAISAVDGLIDGHSLPEIVYDRFKAITEHVSRMKVHFKGNDLIWSGIFESLMIVAVVLLLLGAVTIALRGLRSTRKFSSISIRK